MKFKNLSNIQQLELDILVRDLSNAKDRVGYEHYAPRYKKLPVMVYLKDGNDYELTTHNNSLYAVNANAIKPTVPEEFENFLLNEDHMEDDSEIEYKFPLSFLPEFLEFHGGFRSNFWRLREEFILLANEVNGISYSEQDQQTLARGEITEQVYADSADEAHSESRLCELYPNLTINSTYDGDCYEFSLIIIQGEMN